MLAHVAQMVFSSGVQFVSSYVGMSQQLHQLNQASTMQQQQQQQQLAAQGPSNAALPPFVFTPQLPPGTVLMDRGGAPALVDESTGEAVLAGPELEQMIQQQWAEQQRLYQQYAEQQRSGRHALKRASRRGWTVSTVMKRLVLLAVAFYLGKQLYARWRGTATADPAAAAQLTNSFASSGASPPHYHATTASWDGDMGALMGTRSVQF